MSAERSIWQNARELCLFAGVAGLLLAGVYQLTAPRIALEQQRQARQALAQVTGVAADQMHVLTEEITGEVLGYTQPVEVRLIYGHDNRLRALALPLRTLEGYNGRIEMLLGLAPDGRVLGVAVTEHNETPGLADGIERRRGDWIEQFDGHAAGQPPQPQWSVQRDGGEFDQLTGATITSRAIAEALGAALHSTAVQTAIEQAPAVNRPYEEIRP